MMISKKMASAIALAATSADLMLSAITSIATAVGCVYVAKMAVDAEKNKED